MNKIVKCRSSEISKSLKALESFSIEEAIIHDLERLGKIDSAKSAMEKQKIVMEYFIHESLRYNPYIPIFYRNEKEIVLYQEKFFDAFVLSSMFAGFLKGVDQYPAGLCMYEHGFEQFSVFCHYTSIYQLVNVMLQLHGICFVAKPFSGQKVEVVSQTKTEVESKKIVKGTPTYLEYPCLKGEYKNGKWVFVGCSFSHEERWKRFAEILKKYISNQWTNQIPNGVKRYYGYLNVIEQFKKNRWKSQMRYSIDLTDREFRNILNKSWVIIPKIRHAAIYRNFRYDVMERPYASKGIYPKELLDVKIKLLREFNEALIDWTCRGIMSTINQVREIMANDSLFFRCLNDVTKNPIIALVDIDLKRIQKSVELDRINKNIREIMPLLLS